MMSVRNMLQLLGKFKVYFHYRHRAEDINSILSRKLESPAR